MAGIMPPAFHKQTTPGPKTCPCPSQTHAHAPAQPQPPVSLPLVRPFGERRLQPPNGRPGRQTNERNTPALSLHTLVLPPAPPASPLPLQHVFPMRPSLSHPPPTSTSLRALTIHMHTHNPRNSHPQCGRLPTPRIPQSPPAPPCGADQPTQRMALLSPPPPPPPPFRSPVACRQPACASPVQKHNRMCYASHVSPPSPLSSVPLVPPITLPPSTRLPTACAAAQCVCLLTPHYSPPILKTNPLSRQQPRTGPPPTNLRPPCVPALLSLPCNTQYDPPPPPPSSNCEYALPPAPAPPCALLPLAWRHGPHARPPPVSVFACLPAPPLAHGPFV